MEHEKHLFDSLEDFYKKIETYRTNTGTEISTDLMRLSKEATDSSIKFKLQIEQYIFDFSFREGEISPRHSAPGENGRVYTYPAFEDFNTEAYSYIEARAAKVENDYLVARYNQILWFSPLKPKRIQSAKNAIDAYLRILSSFKKLKDDHDYWVWYQAITNGLLISVGVKYNYEAFYLNLTNLISQNRHLNYQYKFFFLDKLSQQPKYLTRYLNETNNLLIKLITIAKKKKEHTILKQMYEAGLRIAKKTKADTDVWHERIGDHFVSDAEHRMNDETKMIPLHFYKEAITSYKLARAKKKVKETEGKYASIKNDLKLNHVHIPIDDKTFDIITTEIESRVTALFKFPPESIYEYLSKAQDIIPDMKVFENMNTSEGFFTQFASTIKFDINNNISQVGGSTEQDKMLESYSLYIRLFTLPFLNRIFVEGIIKNKINYEGLIQYILKNTWLGGTFKDSETNMGHSYNWVSLIAPAIHEYFKQTEIGVKSMSQNSNYILAIDSITIKFEGALRDFAKTIGISPTKSDKKNILREKYIEEILAEEKIKNYFNESELFFFNNLFVSKSGFNLRNNIAHSFFKYNNYSFQLMHLLIIAFLRLGKYAIRDSSSK